VSNPVTPPPSAGDGSPPPADEGFGSAPAPADEGLGDAPAPADEGFGDAPAPVEPGKKRAVGRVVLTILGAVVIVIVIVVVAWAAFFGDKAKNAAVGDCLAATQDVRAGEEADARAEVVACGSADAAYTVVGRVDGESSLASKSCEKFFEKSEAYAIYASKGSGGYLLCLRPEAS
jgi:hypothetical protein